MTVEDRLRRALHAMDRKLEAARERRTQKRLAARQATLDGQPTTARM